MLRFVDRVADNDQRARQDLQTLRRPAEFLHARLHVRIELLPIRKRASGGENDFRGLGGELAARVGRARLHDDRPALDGPRDVEGAADFEKLALVVEGVHAVGIEIDARLDVADERVFGETVPETGHDIVELARAAISLIVVQMILEAEIESSVRIGGGHDVPAGAPSADVVERGEAPGDVIGLVEGGGRRRDEPDALGRAGKSGQEGQGLE